MQNSIFISILADSEFRDEDFIVMFPRIQDPSCSLCKISDKSLLIASHIKPWKNSEAEIERFCKEVVNVK